jgi:hypothetical protein
MSHETPRDFTPPADLSILARRALLVGAVFGAITLVGLFVDRAAFFRAYLVAYVDVLGIALGSLGLMLLHHMTRGAWGLMVRRIFEASSRTLPWLALLFLPILAGLPALYPWARPGAAQHDAVLAHQSVWMNPGFYTGRAVLYFAIWIGFTLIVNRLSKRQDETGDAALERRMQRFAGPGVIAYVLAMTFASFDWIMSVNPHWTSTIFGLYIVAGQVISGLSFTLLAALYLRERPPMSGALQPRHFHDYGKLLLAFVMLWAYFAISQFLIIWSGDLPEEISFYRVRLTPGWKLAALGIVILHFALPFVLLLSRELKRDPKPLARIALLLLVMRWVDLFWLVAPAFRPEGIGIHWLDVTAPLALCGIFVFLFARELGARALLPVNDPGLPAALETAAHHG